MSLWNGDAHDRSNTNVVMVLLFYFFILNASSSALTVMCAVDVCQSRRHRREFCRNNKCVGFVLARSCTVNVGEGEARAATSVDAPHYDSAAGVMAAGLQPSLRSISRGTGRWPGRSVGRRAGDA